MQRPAVAAAPEMEQVEVLAAAADAVVEAVQLVAQRLLRLTGALTMGTSLSATHLGTGKSGARRFLVVKKMQGDRAVVRLELPLALVARAVVAVVLVAVGEPLLAAAARLSTLDGFISDRVAGTRSFWTNSTGLSKLKPLG
jgi:hypothetical protein